MECFLAASATMCIPTVPTTPPLASTACAPTSTLLTRAIMANTAQSAISVVCIPASDSFRAMMCPSYFGAPSATTTWNSLFLLASLRKRYVVSDMPNVKITSFAWMCSTPCTVMDCWMLSSSSISSLMASMMCCLFFHWGTLFCFFFVDAWDSASNASATAASPPTFSTSSSSSSIPTSSRFDKDTARLKGNILAEELGSRNA
mmetsp:Transcript_26872/g.58637  ORF Transcript_26872/g.58637 Transcript_26872/m.58637 type:complete len:203 (+) Transcript_26872:1251-1859(+)